jgi:[protein-PII] uridylyltransferase
MRLLTQRRNSGAASAIEVSHQKRVEVSELVLAALDQPGLLAEVAGVLHANKINIVDAAIYSRLATPGQAGEALDIFRVRDSYGRLVTDEGRWAKIAADLEAVVSGKIKVESLVAARPRGDSITMWKVPEVPTEIKIDNESSRDFTIVEVITGDYPGVLYEIARTMFGQGLDIHRSKIATEANRVVDTFYVRGRASGEKVVDAGAIASLRDALRESLPTATT